MRTEMRHAICLVETTSSGRPSGRPPTARYRWARLAFGPDGSAQVRHCWGRAIKSALIGADRMEGQRIRPRLRSAGGDVAGATGERKVGGRGPGRKKVRRSRRLWLRAVFLSLFLAGYLAVLGVALLAIA